MRLSSGHTASSESASVKDRAGENYNNVTLDVTNAWINISQFLNFIILATLCI